MNDLSQITSQNAKFSRIGKTYQAMPGASQTFSGAYARLSRQDQAIITKIVGEFVNRSRQGIQEWRQAIEAADNYDNPRWYLLQDLFEYLEPDGHLGSQVDIRKGATEANHWYIRDSKTNKEQPDKTKLLQKEWFFNLVGELLDSIFKGYTVVQLIDSVKMIWTPIPRRNFVPQKDMVLFEVNGDEGVNVTDPAFQNSIICIKSQRKFGIMNDIIPDLVWKKNSRQSWAEFSEKFGQPLLTATTNKADQKSIDRIEAMLQQLGEAARAVLPAGTTIDIKSALQSGDPYKVYLLQANYSDEQISKRYLGGTMISDNGSSRSQSEVHERTLNYILAERDRRMIEFAVNDQLIPILRNIGMPFSDTDEFIYDRSEDLRLTEQWNIVNQALSHYDIPDEWVSETFNFPIKGRKPQPNPVIPPTIESKGNDFFA